MTFLSIITNLPTNAIQIVKLEEWFNWEPMKERKAISTYRLDHVSSLSISH